MPHKRASNKNPKHMLSSNRIERYASRCIFPCSGTANSLSLRPDLTTWGPRVNSMADGFGLFRFTMLKLSMDPAIASTDCWMAVSTGEIDTFPVIAATACQCQYFAINFGGQTTPTYLPVPRSFLVGSAPLTWFKTFVGVPEVTFNVQGNIFAGAGTSATFNILIEFEIEFTDWLPTGSTPLAVPRGFKPVEGCPDLLRRVVDSSTDATTSKKSDASVQLVDPIAKMAT